MLGCQKRNVPSSKILPVPQEQSATSSHRHFCNLGARNRELGGILAALQAPEACMGGWPPLAEGFKGWVHKQVALASSWGCEQRSNSLKTGDSAVLPARWLNTNTCLNHGSIMRRSGDFNKNSNLPIELWLPSKSISVTDPIL